MVSSVLEGDPGLGKLLDRVALDVNQVHRFPVELLVIGIFQTRPLGTKVVRHLPRRKQLPQLGVANTITCLFDPEIVRLFVGLGIDQVILVQGDPIAEAAILPDALVEGLAFLRSVVKGVALAPVVHEACKSGLAVPEQLRVVGLDALLLLGGEVALAHRQGEVRSSLEDLEVAGHGAPGLRNLHTRGAGADNGTALVFHVDFFLGPERRVVDDALELVHAGPWGNITLGSLKA